MAWTKDRLSSPSFIGWAKANVPHPFPPNFCPQVTFKQFTHGQSNLTVLVTLLSTPYSNVTNSSPLFHFVVRMPPSRTVDDAKRTAHRMDWEFELLRALKRERSVPVPQVYALCTDIQVLGCVFYAMEYVPGRVFKDSRLQELTPLQRRMAYVDFVDVLAKLHKVDVAKLGIDRFSRKVNSGAGRRYLESQRRLWMRRVKGNDAILLGQELAQELSLENEGFKAVTRPCLVHGDWRIDNVLWHLYEPKVVAVLDWELASVGDPRADLATCCSMYWMGAGPAGFETLQSLQDVEGIPPEKTMVALYNLFAHPLDRLSSNEMRILISFASFRMAGILFGVQERGETGSDKVAYHMVRRGLDVLQSHSRTTEELGTADIFYSAWRGQRDESKMQKTEYESLEGEKSIGGTDGSSVEVVKENENGFKDIRERLIEFMRNEVLPLEQDFTKHSNTAHRWEPWPPMELLKNRARHVDLWNLWLPRELGGRFTNLQYASLAEIMGRCIFASECFNCSAPDTGNMEILARFGTENQKKQWLEPLLEGKIRSCFAMTEPEVASSDPLNLATKIERDVEGKYKIHGRKWWTSGAMDPRTELIILIGKGPMVEVQTMSISKYQQHTILLVPAKYPGVKIHRALKVFGYEDSPHGHAEIEFDNVVVESESALLHKEGHGFEIAQSRLGAGRIHHCMRLIGMAERGFEMMVDRSLGRTAFGHKLIDLEGTRTGIARSRCEIEQGRLLTRAAARALDDGNIEQARRYISMSKIVVPTMACNVLDRAIQIFGGMGVSEDTVLARLWAVARTIRIADGPDSVHRKSLVKQEIACLRKQGKLTPAAHL